MHGKRRRWAERTVNQGPSHWLGLQGSAPLDARTRENLTGAKSAQAERSGIDAEALLGPGEVAAWGEQAPYPRGTPNRTAKDCRALMPKGREAGVGRTKVTGQSRRRTTATIIWPARAHASPSCLRRSSRASVCASRWTQEDCAMKSASLHPTRLPPIRRSFA